MFCGVDMRGMAMPKPSGGLTSRAFDPDEPLPDPAPEEVEPDGGGITAGKEEASGSRASRRKSRRARRKESSGTDDD